MLNKACHIDWRFSLARLLLFWGWSCSVLNVATTRAVDINVSDVQLDAELKIDATEVGYIVVQWPVGNRSQGSVRFNLDAHFPLIDSLALSSASAENPLIIARHLSPFTTLTVGSRNLDTPGGWTIFFDKVHQRPYQRHLGELEIKHVRASAQGSRGSVAFGPLTAGAFQGELIFTFYSGVPLMHVEAVLSTAENGRAIIYDAGLVSAPGQVKQFTWCDHDESLKSRRPAKELLAAPRSTRYRTLVAEMHSGGSIAVFPTPHQYLYPLDFADNFGFNWCGRDYATAPRGDGWGVRQTPEGDGRFVPWVNAPPGTKQRLGAFYYLSAHAADQTLEDIKRFTHSDSYVPLPGYKTFTSHYHIEHSLELLKQQSASKTRDIPPNLLVPDFVKAFRKTGVDIVHLAEFHNGQTPKLETSERLRQLRAMHDECQRLSDETFLLLPGEEPNVHLGGHWISFFPRPVLWVLNRPAGTPFEERTTEGERLYHVGSQADVLELMRREGGLMWTAHPRIKSSLDFPDQYRETDFYRADEFLGAAWKAMPADYSRNSLGWRALDLFDDMNNWGQRKQVLGEVDVFKVQPGYELYGHANINYIRLEHLPRFDEGWQSILRTLRTGDFFTTTGEILITKFSIERQRNEALKLIAHLDWTFPLSHLEIIGGDGQKTHRHRIDLGQSKAFSRTELTTELPDKFQSCRWLRIEVWDIATNGAFTQPVWFPAASSP